LILDFRFFSDLKLCFKGAKLQRFKGAEKKTLQHYHYVKFHLIFGNSSQRNLLTKSQSRTVLNLERFLYDSPELNNNTMKKIIILFFTILTFHHIQAQEVKTMTYFQNDTIKLDLDLYLPQKKTNEKTPLILFAFGGGFSGGERTSEKDFGMFMAKNGYAVASISYSLYMKEKDFGCKGTLTEKIKAIQIGVSDMWQATSFLIQHANQHNLDTSKFFVSGISAGAEIGFHASFWDYKLMNLYAGNLPENFKYSGFIGGSGAIMDINLITKEKAIPMLLAHGNNDTTVPYSAGSHRSCPTNASGWLILFGSYAVYNQMNDLHKDIELITFCGGGHEYSGYLFHDGKQYVLDFVNDVLKKKNFTSHIIIPSKMKEVSSGKYLFCK
jgi:poly(3-hydroxybutyrate) depolymerase